MRPDRTPPLYRVLGQIGDESVAETIVARYETFTLADGAFVVFQFTATDDQTRLLPGGREAHL